MDAFVDEASRIRSTLEDWIELFGLPFEVFADAGGQGILQIFEKGITPEDATFADHIVAPALYVPKDVIKAMCLGATYLLAGLDAHAKGHTFAVCFLIKAAEEVGFCSGAAFGVIHEDLIRRTELSISGKKGALSRHKAVTELKAWALAQAKDSRSADRVLSRSLARRIPDHLADASTDPVRVIYETLLAKNNPK